LIVVMPAQAGIQQKRVANSLDSGLRRNDERVCG
jgi:hypothetical protein